MGSSDFYEYHKSNESAKATYDAIVAEDRTTYGRNPYSGSIATTAGVRVVQDNPVPYAVADRLAQEQIHSFFMWEACGAIAVAFVPETARRKVTAQVKVTAEDVAQHSSLKEAVYAIARAKTEQRVRAGETFEDVRVTKQNNGLNVKDNITAKYKTTTRATEGKTQTRYFITVQGAAAFRERPREWAQGHISQAAAREALTKTLLEREDHANPWGGTTSSYGIVSETRRESGEPLVVAEVALVSATAEVEYSFVKLAAKPEREGWLFFGWAAS